MRNDIRNISFHFINIDIGYEYIVFGCIVGNKLTLTLASKGTFTSQCCSSETQPT